MTKENSPSVRMFMGKVRKTRIGFKIALTSPKTKATSKAVPKPATVTPGNTAANIRITTALTIKFKMTFIALLNIIYPMNPV